MQLVRSRQVQWQRGIDLHELSCIQDEWNGIKQLLSNLYSRSVCVKYQCLLQLSEWSTAAFVANHHNRM